MNEATSHPFEESPERIAGRLMQKAQNQDGLGEIAAGLILLTFSGLYGLQSVFQSNSLIYKASNYGVLGMMLLLLVPVYGSKWLIKKLRMRYLIGKVGYVKLKPLNRRQIGTMIVTGVVSLIVAVVVAYVIGSRNHFSLLSWMLAVNGILGGVLAFVGGRNVRYFVAGGVLAAIGVALVFSVAPLNLGMAILYGFIGFFCLGSGSIALLTLLRGRAETAE